MKYILVVWLFTSSVNWMNVEATYPSREACVKDLTVLTANAHADTRVTIKEACTELPIVEGEI